MLLLLAFVVGSNNRIFSKKNYLQPIPANEIALNPELKQNPQC
jgi:hypothetical protein